MGQTIKIANMFRNTLYLHGDRGNLQALRRVAKTAEIDLVINDIELATKDFNPLDYDIMLFGAGEIVSVETIVSYLEPLRDKIVEFIESGRVVLVTGTSQCIFGKDIKREDGSIVKGLGIIDCDYTEREYVYGDDLHFKINYDGEEMEIFGTQIQMMNIESKDEPFGKLLYGFGNDNKSDNEGVQKNNSIFTNTLGPMLVLNPWLARGVLNQAVLRTNPEFKMPEMDFSLEKLSLESKIRFTDGKAKPEK